MADATATGISFLTVFIAAPWMKRTRVNPSYSGIMLLSGDFFTTLSSIYCCADTTRGCRFSSTAT